MFCAIIAKLIGSRHDGINERTHGIWIDNAWRLGTKSPSTKARNIMQSSQGQQKVLRHWRGKLHWWHVGSAVSGLCKQARADFLSS